MSINNKANTDRLKIEYIRGVVERVKNIRNELTKPTRRINIPHLVLNDLYTTIEKVLYLVAYELELYDQREKPIAIEITDIRSASIARLLEEAESLLDIDQCDYKLPL